MTASKVEKKNENIVRLAEKVGQRLTKVFWQRER